MKPSLKSVLAALAVVVLGAAVLVPVAGANGMMGGGSPALPRPTMTGSPASTPSPGPTATSDLAGAGWCGGGMWGGSGSWGGTGMWGTGSGASWLTDDPEALHAWLQLRAAHVAAMQTWRDTYKADLASTQAQQALHDLWTGNWNDMKAFYEQYGDGATWTCPALGMWGGWQRGGMMGGSWDPSHMWGTAYGASWMSRHPGAFGQWMTMRARQTATVSAWQQRYAGDLTGSKATAAMRTMQARLRTQVKGFYRDHHLTATTARMRYGAGGWMGLGGMWGGWGW